MKALLDTFALIEILEDNADYAALDEAGVCGAVHLVEIFTNVQRRYSAEAAEEAVRALWHKVVDVELEDVLASGPVYAQLKKKGASHIDCLGYAMAQRRKIPFVTGDKAFKGMPGVLP